MGFLASDFHLFQSCDFLLILISDLERSSRRMAVILLFLVWLAFVRFFRTSPQALVKRCEASSVHVSPYESLSFSVRSDGHGWIH